MSKNVEYDWNESKLIDEIEFHDEDAKRFKQLLKGEETFGSTVTSREAGSLLKGKIVELSGDFATVDVGLKSEGQISLAEFSHPEKLRVGDEIEVALEQHEGENGQVVLSREKAQRQRQWENIVENCKEGSIVEGKVIRKVKGGLIVDIGMEAFLPGSQIDNRRIKNLDEYIGKRLLFKILKINIDRKNIVVSRKEILDEERSSKKADLLEKIYEGESRKGVVKNITDFGVFLDLDGIDGLLHITDMTWKRIKHPSEMVHVGDELEVVVLHIDKERGRVALGLKQKGPNPWEEMEKRYPPGTRVHGKIVNLVPYGAFIEIEPGIEGLIHISEMSWKNVADPSEVVRKGEEVEAVVLGVQKEEGKISLGLKQRDDNPWEQIEERYPVGKSVRGEVRNLTNYKVFVELEEGIDGLIRLSDLSWIKKVSRPSEMFNKGDIVDAVVLGLDHDNRKIILGIKQLAENPWDSIEESLPIGATVSGRVTKVAAFGVFVELENGIEGLVHVTELSDKPFGKIEEIVNVGDVVDAKVIKLDPEHKKISLSLKGSNMYGSRI